MDRPSAGGDRPDELHWSKAVFVMGVYAGPAADAGDVFAPFATLGNTIADLSGIYPYVAVHSDVDALIPDGIRAYIEVAFRR